MMSPTRHSPYQTGGVQRTHNPSIGNTLVANTSNGNGGGFGLIESSGNTLEGNTANDNTDQGIRVEAGSTDNEITANQTLGNGGFDLFDGHGDCASNIWSSNIFVTSDPACIS